MRGSRRRFLSVLAAVAVTGSSRAETVTHEQFKALGTEARISIIGRPGQTRAALLACRDEVRNIESLFSLYDSTSMLSCLNRDGEVATNESFSTLLRHALNMAKATDGAFDPSIQPVWDAIATGGDLKRARELVGWQDVRLTQTTVRLSRPGMALSLNGIAQGYAADRVSRVLARHGFAKTLVDLGEFAARGTNDRRPWRLGIRNPVTGGIDTLIEPNDNAIATSEPLGTLIVGRSHIIDPMDRIGDRWASVTVEASEAWRADALSTAIAASPAHDWERQLKSAQATRAWLINTSGNLFEWQA